MPQFDLYHFTSQLFWLVLVFGFLYIVVAKFIAPKAEGILSARNRYLSDNIEDSENYNNQARSLEELKNKKLEELDFEAEEIQHAALKELEKKFDDKKKKLSLVISKKTESAGVETEKYINSFHFSEPKASVDLASFIIEKITGKPADLKILNKIYQEKYKEQH